jgi:hypothetical protein
MSTERKDCQQPADRSDLLEQQYAELKRLREDILLLGEKLRAEKRRQQRDLSGID